MKYHGYPVYDGIREKLWVSDYGTGQFAKLAEVQSRHWQLAGPEGAIITEVANVHCNGCVRHSDQGINDNFLGK